MNRLLFTTLITALLVFTLAPAAFGQETTSEPVRPVRAKPKREKPASVKPVPAKAKSAKPSPVKPASAQTELAQAPSTEPASLERPAPVQSADAQQPLLGEDEPLPFMRAEDANAPAEPSSSGLILKSIGALMLVIGVLVFGTWSMKKLGFGNKAAKGANSEVGLEVLSTLPMGGGKTISMVQFGERVLLVGSTGQSFTLLAEQGPQQNTFETHPRSVADMLADDGESESFDDEFERAMAQLENRSVYGGIA